MTTTQVRAVDPPQLGAFSAVVGQAVRVRLRLVGVVCALMVGMGLLVGSLWPSLKGTFAELQNSLPEAFSTLLAGADMSTASGWANAEMMSMVAPAGAIAVAVISATRAIAGEEEDKTLGMLLGTPVSRSAFMAAKTVAMLVHVLLVSLAISVGLWLGSLAGDMGLSASGVLAAGIHAGLLGAVFGSAALTIASLTGSRRLTVAASSALAGLAFALSSFLPLSESLANGAKASPWYYYNSSDPLANGLDPMHILVLLALAAVMLVAAALSFERRDLKG